MFARRSVVIRLVTLVSMATNLAAAPGDLDLSFQSSRGASGDIETIVEQPDGKMIIGGDFTRVDDVPRSRIARLNPDGSLDRRFLSGLSGANAVVRTALLQSDGKILIGGAFTTVNGVPRGRLARLNSDGTLDTGFMNGLAGVGNQPVNLGIYSIALQPDGKVLVGGAFSAVNGAPRGGVARLNADGSLDTGFMDGLAGADSTVRAVVQRPDGKVLIGGYFGKVNGVTRKGIARLNGDGTLDGGFRGDITGTVHLIKAVAVQDDGMVVVGGFNFNIGGAVRGGIARLNSDGTEDSGFRAGAAGYGTEVHSLALQPDGKIVVGGHQMNRPEGRLERLHSDGSADSTFRSTYFGNSTSFGPSASVQAIHLRGDGTVLLGGWFTEITTPVGTTIQSCNRIVRLLSNGDVDPGLVTAQAGTNSNVSAVVAQADGKVLAAGTFSKFNDTGRGTMLRLNGDGTPDAAFPAYPVGSFSSVRTVALQEDGKIMIGGDFGTVFGEAHNYAARLNSDASLDSTFLSSLPVGTPPVSCIAMQLDGKALVAANDSTFALKPFVLTRLNVDGTVDESFTNGLVGMALQVWCLAALPGGKILVGGEARTGNVSPSRLLWRLNSDGSHDAVFAASLSGSSVRTIALQSDGKILIGGSFSRAGVTARGNIARLNSDGSIDPGFMSGLSGPNGIVRCIALQPDGKVLIGGEFTTVNGVARNRIARLNTDGSLDTAFLNGQAGAIQTVTSIQLPAVQTISLQNDGRVLIGGVFNSVNGVYRGNIARLYGDAPDIAVEQPAGTAFLHDSSTAVNFGPVPQGESARLTFTLRNAGNLNLTGLNLTKISGNALDDFTIGIPEADNLAPNASTTFMVNFSPQASGTRSVLMEIASNDPDEAPFLLRLTGKQASSLDLWRRDHFGSFSNSGASGDFSDPDGDGKVNAVEFATRTDPLSISPPAWKLMSAGDSLEFTYSRPIRALEALRYDVEWSDETRGPWFSSGSGAVLSDDGTVQQMKVILPAGSAGRRFVRLRVTVL